MANYNLTIIAKDGEKTTKCYIIGHTPDGASIRVVQVEDLPVNGTWALTDKYMSDFGSWSVQ